MRAYRRQRCRAGDNADLQLSKFTAESPPERCDFCWDFGVRPQLTPPTLIKPC